MKIDVKKDCKDLYQPGSKDFVEVDVPAMTYLSIEGHGDPNTSPSYAAAVAALYAGAYAIKFALKARTGEDFVVGPLGQIMHIGTYDSEAATLARLHTEVMPTRGCHLERTTP